MNTQRFYLYLNMTKPRELLCLSFCQSDSQGKALSPAFLINNIREMFPEMEIRQCGEVQDSMELLELPESVGRSGQRSCGRRVSG